MSKQKTSSFYPALLKYWRGRREMSQLDLAHSASVSSRHISFLETGRSQPSREMILSLASTLDLPLRVRNEMLVAAGFLPVYRESLLDDGSLDPGVQTALRLVLERHEPYPAIIMNGRFDIVRTNVAARRFLELICKKPDKLGAMPNGYHVFLHPDLGKEAVREWPEVAALLVGLLHRKVLKNPQSQVLQQLFEDVLALPDINRVWQTPDLDVPASGVFTFHFESKGFTGAFLTTLTTFIAPNNITLEELSIESYYPLDDYTASECQRVLSHN